MFSEIHSQLLRNARSEPVPVLRLRVPGATRDIQAVFTWSRA